MKRPLSEIKKINEPELIYKSLKISGLRIYHLPFIIYHSLVLLSISVLLLGCEQQTLRRSDYSVHGIDVSHYQSRIDWQKVAEQDVHFAFIKATEGETLRDSLFTRNWEAMKTAGIKRGAYHFFHPSISAATQAQHFALSVNLQDGDLPPVLDVELTNGIAAEELRIHVATWLRMVETVFQIKPVIYTNQAFFNHYLAGHFEEYPVWIARYNSRQKPELLTKHPWDFWQYGNRGRLKGILGDVDFNVFRGSMEELETLCLQKMEPVAIPLATPISTAEAISTNP